MNSYRCLPNKVLFGASPPTMAPTTTTTTTDTLCLNLQKLWLNETTADIHFVADNIRNESQLLPAHKCLLAVDSSVFYRRFFIDLEKESNIEICDVSAEVFSVFLSSFYQHKIAVTDRNVSDLIYLAKQYNAHNCMTQCEQFLKDKLTTENVCYAFELATVCNDMQMYRSCLMVIEKNFRRVLTTNGFLHCSHNVLKHILLSNIENRDEFALFEACMHWAKTSLERNNVEHNKMMDWRTELGECFELIRFGAMTPLQFMKCETIYPVFTTAELTEIKLRIISLADNGFQT
ncbi:BTB/POZ domain-containing protein 6-like [Sitodiplosis mosellana]|uniref:BTB/POZ domain-containing protein 6-like n=1 Tax=Sitodiplosis mosellana TaxID=263140 RepID=UPI0024442C43|nr:BTB/POZ domain-containing protein 6-like [Sitodiplosis mosellana]